MSPRVRTILALLLALAVLGVGAVFAVSSAWPHFRPPLRPGEAYGIDVSIHQDRINWAQVAEDDIAYAYLKASEGATWEDAAFLDNVAGARANGIEIGAYHFFTLCRPGAEQAAHFLRRISSAGGPSVLTLSPVVDLELSGNCADRPEPEQVLAEVATFVDAVEGATGQRVTIYALSDFTRLYKLPREWDNPRWVRRLGVRPEGDWVWWQVHNSARIDGIAGPADLNVVRTRG